MDPWKDQLNTGYQLVNALITLGRGQLTGVGLGDGVGKLLYLPESHTDFLLAVIGEELGLIGVLAVVGLFAWLTWRAFSIGWQAGLMGRNFAALVAQGVGVWMGTQAFINMGVNLGLLPTKGLTLPLMSYGGSGIVANCLALAVLLRIDFENRCLMRGKKA
jgi:cell division protein FtsW